MARLYRAPILAAIAAGALGFPIGLYVLGRAAEGPLGDADIALIEVHGSVQLLGWAGLFVVGVASHVIPRFFGNTSIPFPWPQRLTLYLVVAGLGLRAVAQPGTWLPHREVALVTSGAATAAGWLTFAWTMLVVLRTGSEERRAVARWLWLGTIGSIGTALLYLGLSVDLATRVEPGGVVFVSPAWNIAFQQVALFGLLLPFAFGVSARAVAGFLDLPPRDERADRAAVALLSLGTLLTSLGASGGAGSTPSRVGVLLLAAAIVLFAVALRILPLAWSRRPRADRWLRRYAVTAYLWLLGAGVLMTISAVATDGSLSIPRSAGLHLVTVGFLTTLILGFAHKALPLFERRPLPLARAVPAAFGLLHTGVALRLAGALPLPLPGSLEVDAVLLRLGGVLSVLGFLVGIAPVLVLLLRSRASLPGAAPPPEASPP